MSKTRKHQLRYLVRNSDFNSISTEQWNKIPNQKGRRGKFFNRWSNRILRREIKKLINRGEYVLAEVKRVKNIDWLVW